MSLTDTAIKSAKAGIKPYKLSDASAAYNYAIYLSERKSMMQHWGDYLEGCTSQKVLPMKRRAA